MTLYPSIVSDSNATTRGIIADRIMTHGYSKAAKMSRKAGLCFTLFYFLAFGQMPRKAAKPAPVPQALTLGGISFPII